MISGIVPLAAGAFGTAHPAARTLHVDPGRMMLRSVITTADPDRAGDVVLPNGLRNSEEYMMNPVVLWAHTRTQFPPIGMCEWLDIQPSRIVAQTRFAGGTQLSEDVFKLYEQKVLRGWSIGFVPRKGRRLPAADGRPSGLRVDEWDLLEYSAVPIPENPGAVTVAVQKGLVKDPALKLWLSRLPDDTGGRWWPVGDVMANLVAARDEVVCSE